MLGVQKVFFDSNISEKLEKMEASIRSSFEAVKKEMDNHLDSINKNTDEIQHVYDYLSELEAKMNKLSERMEKVEMMNNPSHAEPLSCNVKLNRREQEVFMVLYASDDKVTTDEIARKLGFSDEMVINYLYNLIAKGVPIRKECIGNRMVLSLNKKFENLQAKKNILDIEESVAKEVMKA